MHFFGFRFPYLMKSTAEDGFIQMGCKSDYNTSHETLQTMLPWICLDSSGVCFFDQVIYSLSHSLALIIMTWIRITPFRKPKVKEVGQVLRCPGIEGFISQMMMLMMCDLTRSQWSLWGWGWYVARECVRSLAAELWTYWSLSRALLGIPNRTPLQ